MEEQNLMKNKVTTTLTVIACVALLVGAVCLGAVRGWQKDRQEILLGCVELHAVDADDIRESIEECEAAAAEFDRGLSGNLTGKIAHALGVEPIGDSLDTLHSRLMLQATPERQAENTLQDLGEQIEDLLDDHIDTSLSLGKVIWTVVLLMVIFGKKNKRGISLGKLLAGYGLFRTWRKK